MRKIIFILILFVLLISCTKVDETVEKARNEPTLVRFFMGPTQKPAFVSQVGCQNGKIHSQLGNPLNHELNLRDVVFTVNQRQDIDPGCNDESLMPNMVTECLSIDNNGAPLSGKVSLVIDAGELSLRTEVSC